MQVENVLFLKNDEQRLRFTLKHNYNCKRYDVCECINDDVSWVEERTTIAAAKTTTEDVANFWWYAKWSDIAEDEE